MPPEVLREPEGSLAGTLDFRCSPAVDGHQQWGQQYLDLQLALDSLGRGGQMSQAIDRSFEVLGRLVNGGSGQRLLAGRLPEVNGAGVLTGVRQVMSNEVG